MVRTIIFFSCFWFSLFLILPIGLVMLILELCGLRFLGRPITGFIVRMWARLIVWGTGTTPSVSGLENVPRKGRVVFMSNHQGNMDFVMILAYLPRTIGFIIKREALFLPLINVWIASMGSIFMNRESMAKGKASIDKGVKKIIRGSVMCIFPEGTRSRSSKLGIFRNGSFKLATRADAVIVPITVDGSYRTFEQNKKITPSPISMVVHPPVPTAGMSAEDRKALPDKVRAIIESALPR